MEPKKTCKECGKPIEGEGLTGLCPVCMMQVGLGSVETNPADPEQADAGRFTAPSVEDLAKRFPQLEIQALIGVGGMGAVYKAHQRNLDRPVALKILMPRKGSDPGFAERFMREARALARLNHPHIVAVYDFGHQDDLSYFIMEFVDGANLREVQKAGELSPEQALAIVPQICEALQFAHNRGVVHRDIKPENVLLDRAGCVKIADFGLAKIVGQQTQNLTLTADGHVMGTPHYMAPEQVEHPHQVDHRADIYSLGVVFYEMLTGELPLGKFAAPSRMVQVDVRLDEVVLKTLEKRPERRYQQVSQVGSEVETIASSSAKTEGRGQRAEEREISAESITEIKRDLRIPGFGLFVSGSLNLAVLSIFAFLYVFQNGMHDLPQDLVFFLALLFFLVLVMLWGSSCMRRLTSYRLAIDAAILAILFSWGSGLGLIFGVWALVVLSRREVRQAFEQVRINKSEAKGRSKRAKPKCQGKHSASRNKHSVIPPVGRRGDRRVLFWPGILNALLATIAIASISASGMGIIISFAGDPVSLWTSLLSAVVVTVVFVLMWIGREWARPLEALPDLEYPGESDELEAGGRALRLRRGLQLCILLVVAFSCAGYVLLKPTVLVSGVVTDASTGEPIANAKVVDFPLTKVEGIPLEEVTTDRTGRYRLYSRYNKGWQASAPGYCTRTEARDKPRFSWLSRRRIEFKLYPLFDPVVERTLYDLNDGEEDTALDIRTGKLFSIDPSVGQSEMLRKAWLRQNEVDLMVDHARNRWALLGVGLDLYDVDATLWDGATGQRDLWPVMERTTMVLERKPYEDGTACLLAQDPCLPATFVFETNDLARGMLQITECLSQPRAVKLRYKLAPTMDAGRASSRLAFRILPGSELTEQEATRLRQELQANGPKVQDSADQASVWIPVDNKNVAPDRTVLRYRNRYVLASNRKHEIMLPDGSWGLENVELAKTNEGRPIVSVHFDGPGADRFFALTSSHAGKPLGIILDDKVISAPLITGGIREQTIIDGNFSRRDAKIKVHALLKGMPPVATLARRSVKEITPNETTSATERAHPREAMPMAQNKPTVSLPDGTTCSFLGISPPHSPGEDPVWVDAAGKRNVTMPFKQQAAAKQESQYALAFEVVGMKDPGCVTNGRACMAWTEERPNVTYLVCFYDALPSSVEHLYITRPEWTEIGEMDLGQSGASLFVDQFPGLVWTLTLTDIEPNGTDTDITLTSESLLNFGPEGSGILTYVVSAYALDKAGNRLPARARGVSSQNEHRFSIKATMDQLMYLRVQARPYHEMVFLHIRAPLDNTRPIRARFMYEGQAAHTQLAYCDQADTTALMPNQRRIRLLGIGKQNKWWRPDGTPIIERYEWQDRVTFTDDDELVGMIQLILPDGEMLNGALSPDSREWSPPYYFGVRARRSAQGQEFLVSVNTGLWQEVGRLYQPGQVTYEDITCVLEEAHVEHNREGHATGVAVRLAGRYTSTRDKNVALVAVGDSLQVGVMRHAIAVGTANALVTDKGQPWSQDIDLPKQAFFDLNDIDHFELCVCPRAWLRLIGFATEPKQ